MDIVNKIDIVFPASWYAILESFKLINFNLENTSPECYAGQFSWDLRWLALMALFVGAGAILALVVQAARWCCRGRKTMQAKLIRLLARQDSADDFFVD